MAAGKRIAHGGKGEEGLLNWQERKGQQIQQKQE